MGLCLCGLELCSAASPPAPLPAAFEETTLIDFSTAGAALTVDAAVTPEAVPDPAGLKRTVLKLSFAAAGEGGVDSPALRLSGAALSRADWRGQDLLALRVYNPDTLVVDLVLVVRAGASSYSLTAALQPNVWNTVLLRLTELTAKKLALEAIEGVHVLLERPVRAVTIHLSTLSLFKERNLRAVEFPSRLPIAGFEMEDEIRGWQAAGVTARLTSAARLQGRHALELVFPAYVQGGPHATSYQARYADRGLPLRDWRGYERFCCELRNSGPEEAPLDLCFRDLTGVQATVRAAIPAGGRLAFAVPLRDLAVDASCLVQVDLSMTEPTASRTIWVDDLRLEAAPLLPADHLLERLEHAGQEASQRGATELTTAYRQTRDVVVTMRSSFERKPTFGGARTLAEALVAAARQTDRLDHELQSLRQRQGEP